MIPLNNSLSKVEAFIPSVTSDFRKHQRVNTPSSYIETLDVLSALQDGGWEIKNGTELRDKKSKRPSSHRFQLQHPDLRMDERNLKNFNSKSHGQINVVNSCDGKSPLVMNIGIYRMVCSNGMMGWGSKFNERVQHTTNGLNQIETALKNVLKHGEELITTFKGFQGIELTNHQIDEIANEAMAIRFGNNHNSDETQLLHVRREEDEGNDLWSVFNRIQENLTNSTLTVNVNGRLTNVGRILSTKEDFRVNTKLTELVNHYA